MPHNSRFSITNPNVVHETIDGETVVLKLDTGVYYSLNDFGGEVWSLLGRGFSVDEIAAACASRFDGPRDQIEATARGLVADLERDELIAIETASDRHVNAPIDGTMDGGPAPSGRALRLPVMRKYEDMQDLLLIDPFHDVPPEGWPDRKDLHASEILSGPIATS